MEFNRGIEDCEPEDDQQDLESAFRANFYDKRDKTKKYGRNIMYIGVIMIF
jgi:hypothetical protein